MSCYRLLAQFFVLVYIEEQLILTLNLNSYKAPLALFEDYQYWIKSLVHLTLSWRRSLSYRNQSIDLLCKSIEWFLYDRDLRHERVKQPFSSKISKKYLKSLFSGFILILNKVFYSHNQSASTRFVQKKSQKMLFVTGLCFSSIRLTL